MTSRTTILTVVFSLALLALALIAAVVYLATQIDVDQHPAAAASVITPLVALLGTAIGSLATMLSSTRGALGANDVEPSQVTLSAPTPVTVSAPDGGAFPGKTP